MEIRQIPSRKNGRNMILALDVGERRIGVAIASQQARLPRPHGVVAQSADILARLRTLVDEEQVAEVVAGLPRNLSGQDTRQTTYVRAFVTDPQAALPVPVYLIDEALTSVQAEAELDHRKKPYAKGDIDALAACYILEDFLAARAHKDHKEDVPS